MTNQIALYEVDKSHINLVFSPPRDVTYTYCVISAYIIQSVIILSWVSVVEGCLLIKLGSTVSSKYYSLYRVGVGVAFTRALSQEGIIWSERWKMMSITKKRALSQDLESGDAKVSVIASLRNNNKLRSSVNNRNIRGCYSMVDYN